MIPSMSIDEAMFSFARQCAEARKIRLGVLMSDERQEKIELLHRQIEHAPQHPGTLAADLKGWILVDVFICAHCAGRIMARGCQLPRPANPVWITDSVIPELASLGCVTCSQT